MTAEFAYDTFIVHPGDNAACRGSRPSCRRIACLQGLRQEGETFGSMEFVRTLKNLLLANPFVAGTHRLECDRARRLAIDVEHDVIAIARAALEVNDGVAADR